MTGYSANSNTASPEAAPASAGRCPSAAVPPPHSLDFWGVKLGMSMAEVRNLMNCLGPDFKARADISSVSFDRSFYVKTPTFEISRGEFGQQDELKVNFAGAVGQERVIRVVKSISFSSQAPASRAAIEKEMNEKFGPLTLIDPRVLSQNTYSSVSDNSGNKIDPKDHVHNLCAQFATDKNRSYGTLVAKYNPMPDKCGLIFSYIVHAKSDIDDKITHATLGTMNYAKAVAALKESVQFAVEHDDRN